MSVGDHDMVDSTMTDARARETIGELANREPGVEENQGLVRAEQSGVPTAPRSEHAQTHGQAKELSLIHI